VPFPEKGEPELQRYDAQRARAPEQAPAAEQASA
jgi:hypothetical protein